MYRSNLGTKDKGGAIIAVVAIHALLLLALLHLSGTLPTPDTQAVLRVFDLIEPQPPPPPPPPAQQPAPKPKAPEGGSAPANIKSQATPVVAPKPVPKPTPIVAAEKPAQGSAATQGAAAVAGPGTGAGGSGNGTGSGSGTGAGSGSGGGVVSPPRLVTPVLRGRDFSRQLLEDWPRGAPVFLRLRVDPQGGVAQCIVDRGTAIAAIDSEVCAAVQQRLRFRPALNAAGQAVAGWFGYVQPPPR